MSTPKIKVYRLEKGYNRDSDNDIQSKINSELLPFIEKPTKPTDAYYLTGISEQLVQFNGKKINVTPQIYDGEIFSSSEGIACSTWIKNGFYRPRLGYLVDEKFVELASENLNEIAILEEIKNVSEGIASTKNYFTKNDFIFAHPLVYSQMSFDEEKPCYSYEYLEDKTTIKFTLDAERITEVFGSTPPVTSNSDYVIQYYEQDKDSKDLVLDNYPIYNHNNYYYNPEIFCPESIELEFDDRISGEITCDDTWIYYGNGKPVVVCDDEILTEGKDYELLYSFTNDSTDNSTDPPRSLRVKISDELFLNQTSNTTYNLYYNTDESLIVEGEDKDYTIDSDTGKITFVAEVPKNVFIYYRKKVQKSKTFVSEYINWSFGHLRENPDIFYGEKDYAGDEAEEAETGVPIYSGMKPTFISSGYQIDYFRGTVNFTDGMKSTYRSEADVLTDRDINTPEIFVRANFSYYPEIHNVFRQKMECVSETDGYIYKPIYDKRFANSIGKRWIIKSDNYQPMFFENWTDKMTVCSQYLTTAPNYEELQNKCSQNIKILATDSDEVVNSKLTFILPMVESKYLVFSGYETILNSPISFKNDNDEIVETFTLSSQKNAEELEIFYLNGVELKQGEIKEFGNKVKMKFIMLCSENNTISFQIVSAQLNKLEESSSSIN